MTLERRIEWAPAFDRRDPDPAKNYGIHGVECRWLLIGPNGAIQFLIYTNWHLPHVVKEQDARPIEREFLHLSCRPVAADIGYHARVPQWNGQTPMTEDCEFIGDRCYYDGSSLRADDVLNLLIEKGADAVWEYMENDYAALLVEAVPA